MFKRILLLTPLLILIMGCSSLEFVYDSSYNNKIKNKTLFSVSGDNKDIINSYLFNIIGEIVNTPVYKLSIDSNTSIEAVVIEIDATASKFVIEHKLKYILNNLDKNCTILEKEILTKSLYNAKSAGYSYGTDIAEKELSIKNLHSNIDQFLKELTINYNDLKCKNES